MAKKHNKVLDSKVPLIKCDYHLCSYEGKVLICKYCKKKFCKDHINPKIPGMPNFKSSAIGNDEAMQEYRKENAHPCTEYRKHYLKAKEEEKARYLEQFNKALKKRQSIDYQDYYYPDYSNYKIKNKQISKKKVKTEINDNEIIITINKKRFTLFIILIILMIIFLLVALK